MVLLSRVERLSGEPETEKDVVLKEQFVDNPKNVTLRRDIKCWARDHPTATFQDVRLEVHRYMEEDPFPEGQQQQQAAEAEEEAQCSEVAGQRKQQKVLIDLISGQKVLAEQMQKQEKVFMGLIEQQRDVLRRQQETLCSKNLTTTKNYLRIMTCFKFFYSSSKPDNVFTFCLEKEGSLLSLCVTTYRPLPRFVSS